MLRRPDIEHGPWELTYFGHRARNVQVSGHRLLLLSKLAFKEGSETINAILLSFIGSILEWMLWKLTIILDLHKQL